MTRRAITLLALVCALSLAAPAAVLAASGGSASQAITDCNSHGRLTAQYSPAVLRQALAQMPADVREYTDCYDVIQRQLLKQIGSTAPGGTATTASSSSGGSFLPAWLIVVIVLLVLAAITLGVMSARRRGGEPGGPGPGAGGPGPSGPGDPGAPPDAPTRVDEPGGPEGPGSGAGA